MSGSNKLELIKGNFFHTEAREILYKMFNTEIYFHHQNNFSSRMRLEIEDPIALERIPALNAELVKLKKILNEAEAKNKKLSINAEITILLTDE